MTLFTHTWNFNKTNFCSRLVSLYSNQNENDSWFEVGRRLHWWWLCLAVVQFCLSLCDFIVIFIVGEQRYAIDMLWIRVKNMQNVNSVRFCRDQLERHTISIQLDGSQIVYINCVRVRWNLFLRFYFALTLNLETLTFFRIASTALLVTTWTLRITLNTQIFQRYFKSET